MEMETISLKINSPNGVSSIYGDPGVAMADSSLRNFKETLSAEVLRAMLTANGGERIRKSGDGWSVMHDGRLRPRRDMKEKNAPNKQAAKS